MHCCKDIINTSLRLGGIASNGSVFPAVIVPMLSNKTNNMAPEKRDNDWEQVQTTPAKEMVASCHLRPPENSVGPTGGNE